MKIKVFHEEIFYDLSLNNEIQMGFPLNGLEFFVFLYYICVNVWKKFKNKFPFVSFEQDMKKIIYVKIWFVKQSCGIAINPNFCTFYHKAKG
jgi:hypothetical protein